MSAIKITEVMIVNLAFLGVILASCGIASTPSKSTDMLKFLPTTLFFSWIASSTDASFLSEDEVLNKDPHDSEATYIFTYGTLNHSRRPSNTVISSVEVNTQSASTGTNKKRRRMRKRAYIVSGPVNTTAYLRDRVEFKCEAVGRPKPEITWRSTLDGDLPKVGSNFRVHKNGSLIFRSVAKENEAGYTCVVNNSLDTAAITSKTAHLIVEAKVKIVAYPEVVREVYGTSKALQCTSVGDPPPVISWLKDGALMRISAWKSEIVSGHEYKPFTDYSRSVLRLNVTETANYTCFALNQMQGGRQSSDRKSFMVYVEEDKKGSGSDGSEATVSRGYCAPYNGRVCRKFLQGRGLVWFNISQDNSGGWLNEQIAQNIWNEVIAKLQEPCRSAAEALLCKYAFPDCILKDGVATGLPLCWEDCVAVRNHFCFNDWAMTEDNKRRGIYIGSRGHFRLPRCEELPKHVNSTKTCTETSITTMKWEEATTNCVKEVGRYYQGHVNVTHDNIICQTWFTNEPHVQSILEGVFPEMFNAGNHCRNPGGTESSPWCYTSDPSVRWQHCDLPKCENTSSTVSYSLEVDVFESQEDLMQEMMSPTFVVLASCIAFATLIIVTFVGLICNKICKSKSLFGIGGSDGSNNNGYIVANIQDAAIDLNKLPQNASYHHTGAQLNPKLEKLEYPRNDIIYIRDVGQGAFGRVFQAKASGLVQGEEFTMVAVKMLKEDASDDLQKDFEREACLLREFDHPNIIRLLGVCAIGKPMCLLFEFMARGDLNAYLRSCNPNCHLNDNDKTSHASGVSISNYSDTIKISHLDQISFSKQICSGMVYLSDRNFVHRDLASRNCLMDSCGTVKIADFGLSQRICSASNGGANYYRGDEEDAIPIRWMPPEAILQNKYTVESDVWAFGVLLWEIFSLAMQPYYGLSHEEVVKCVKSGKTLQCPDNTPKSVYKTMLSCWNIKPSDRPLFRTLHRELETIGRELCLIQKHFRSQKSILSEHCGRITPQSSTKSYAENH